jgi:hypothetical protein
MSTDINQLITDTRNDLIALRGNPTAYYSRLRQYGVEIESVTDPQVELMLLEAYDKFSTWKLEAPTREERISTMFAAVEASEIGIISKQDALDAIRDLLFSPIKDHVPPRLW